MSDPRKEVWIDYTNHRGERSWRRIRPVPEPPSFENNEWHPETQWILEAIDLDKGLQRSFALASIHQWRTTAPVCKYRNSGVGGNDPQECAWPECGCDPAANKVLEHYQECGLTLVREDDIQIARCLLAEARSGYIAGSGPDMEWDKRRDEFLGRMPT